MMRNSYLIFWLHGLVDRTLLCHSRDTSSILVVAVYIFLGSSMVEQSAVNRFVAGSSPVLGA